MNFGTINSEISTKSGELLMIDQLRKKYRPHKIRLLLVAESPPDCRGGDFRFFYAPTVTIDNLYRYVMKAIFADFDSASGPKQQWLERFRDAGCYLVDATDTPVNSMEDKERTRTILDSLPAKIAEIRRAVDSNVPIILIKKNVFELLDIPLRHAGLNVVNQGCIPFPSNGQQKRFKEKFRECLDRIDFRVASA